jgi:YVTN family beta-propeller protein
MDLRPWIAVFNISFRVAIALGIPACAVALTGQRMAAQVDPRPPSSGLINPRAIVFSPATGKIYAVDTSHNAVDIYTDASKQIHRVQAGREPVSVAVNESNGKVYVANSGDGTVSILDGRADAVVGTLPVGSHPYSIAVDSATGNIFVTHTFGSQVSMLNGATNTITDLKTGSADLIAINSKTRTIYLLGYGGAVVELDEASQKFRARDVGKHAWGLTVDDSSGTIYVTRIESADLAALAASSSVPVVLRAGAIPCAIAVNSRAHKLYVANYGNHTVTVLDSRTGQLTATLQVGEHPKAIGFDPDRKLVYVANTSDNSVTVIDADKDKILATLPAGKSPYALAVVPGSTNLYVANESEDRSSTVVDLTGALRP